MSRLRQQLRQKVESADNHLETVKGYLKEVGTHYFERLPELANKFILVYNAVEELQKAVRKLEEEM